MANKTSLVKTILYKSLAEGVYRDVVTRSGSYYYFLGKTLSWDDDNTPPAPVDSYEYERGVRNEIITIKEIKPSDIAFVIPRRDWVADEIYDMYDDQYCDQVIGINVVSGGSGYIDLYDTQIVISGGGGTGATAVVSETVGGSIAGVELTSRGVGYTSIPDVTVISPSGTGAVLKASMGITTQGVQKLEDTKFYVVTDDYNVYKCLDNNNNARSTQKPTGTQLDPIKTLDGYVWKFMYNIPINLRNKFYTDEYIPVVSALTNQFYSNGTIENIFIANKGKGYTTAVVNISGDGYRAGDPLYINGIQVVNPGTGYVNPTIDFTAPFSATSPFSPTNNVNLGQVVFNPDTYDYYEVVTPGFTSAVAPTHRYGTVLNGSAAFKYVGSKLKGTVVKTNPKNITKVDINSAGSQYTTAPTVTIGTVWQPETAVTLNQQIFYGENLYTVTVAGTTGLIDEAPTHNEGEAVNGTATLSYAGGAAKAQATVGTSTITNVTITNGGSGYSSSPRLSFTGGGGQGATAVASVIGGVISTVTVTNAGSGYTSVPTILIEDNTGLGAVLTPRLSGTGVQSIEVTIPGSGYESTPTVSITGGGGAGALASATVETGIISDVILSGSLRDIVILDPGSGYTSPPVVNIIGGGGTNSVVKSKIYADKVISTYIINQGDNFTSVPTVSFGTQWQEGLEVYTNEQYYNGSYLYTVVQDGIFGSSAPTQLWGTEMTSPAWAANSTVVADQTVYVEDRMYKVVGSGLTGGTAPTHTTGTASNGAVNLTYLGKPASLKRAGTVQVPGTVATGIAVLRYGAGYSTTPLGVFNDTSGSGAEVNFFTAKSEAKVSAITEDGQIVYLVIDDPGTGYTKAQIDVSGEGQGASLIADLSLGAISSQQANNEILTPAGTIDAIAIISGGYSYGVANIAIDGDGTGAAAEAVIDPITNAIIKINITSRGQDYTYANVRVIGNGNGAALRAIIAPPGGHGKNSPEELYARSLMFYSNISTDLNQGVTVGNDYRQVGILKNPRVFDGFEKYQGTIGSACFIIQSPVDTTKFFRDDELFIERVTKPSIEWQASINLTLGDFIWYEDRIYTVVVSGVAGSEPPTTTTGSEANGFAVVTYVGSTKSKKRYRIVSVSETSALVQSLDNDIPEANDVFIKTNSITDNFTAVSPGLPNFDKYSGQMMYIDNKSGFTPSGDETITLRTIVTF